MTAFTGFGSRVGLANALETVVPRLGEVSWCSSSEVLPFQVRHALGVAQLNLHSLFGPGNTLRSASEREAAKALEILRQGPQPWSFLPDKGLCQWRDPLGVLLAKFMASPASASVSPETLKLALKLAHHQPGDTVALTWHPDANSAPIPVSLSALAVLAFTVQLPNAAHQQDSFYGHFRSQMVYATPDWWQPDATGLLLGALRNRSSMAKETAKRLAVLKTLVEEGLPVDNDGLDDLAGACQSVGNYNGLDFMALKEEMGQMQRKLIKSRLDHVSAPSSPNVRPPRL